METIDEHEEQTGDYLYGNGKIARLTIEDGKVVTRVYDAIGQLRLTAADGLRPDPKFYIHIDIDDWIYSIREKILNLLKAELGDVEKDVETGGDA